MGRLPKILVESNRVEGEIVSIDRFGNGITNIEGRLLEGKSNIHVRLNLWQLRGIHETYDDVARGEPVALIGSGYTVEVSVRQGNAKDRMKFQIGDRVIVTFDEASKQYE
jgi:S-adenosylmethionine hydrolase